MTGLVSGLTEPLDSATNGATTVVTKPLGDAVKKVGDTVDDITGSLTTPPSGSASDRAVRRRRTSAA